MTPENDDLGAQLTRELHRRTDGMHETPLRFDDVRGRATSIRRRRQLATGLGVAAAVAVIVPTAMFASRGTDSSPQPATPLPTAIDTASATPTSTPTMGSDPHALDVRDLPTGAPPALIYVDTSEGVTSFAMVGDRSIRVINGAVMVTTELSDEVFGPYPTSQGISVNAAGTAAAWTTDDGDVMAWADGGDEPVVVTHSDLAGVSVGAVTGTFCTPGESRDCLFYVSGWNMGADGSESFTVDPNGKLGEVDPAGTILRVNDATDDGRVVGYTEITDFGTCSAVLDPADSGSKPLWDTCDHSLADFSPNGDYVLASDAYGDGIGSGQIAIYATAGDVLAERSRTDDASAFYNSAVWEDETHVLFTAYQDGEWSIVRMGVDGAMEYAVAPQKGNAERVPWHFETR